MMTRVACAFLTLGVRNAGTPLEMASTPVSAEQPLENARSSRRMKATCDRLGVSTVYAADSATGGSPRAVRTRPTTIMRPTLAMKR
ncbi:hypothetical protein CMMCAS03_06495 [Clavibacter michiganensis subsp. michiganensis]|nr:hypothetical protein CMMCAS03_06495 [Clavibacter michiganensis subsp. michiganensis]